MTPDLDILRTASLLIRKHGDVAAFSASVQADEMLAAGDIDGQRVRLPIIKAIRELQDLTKPTRLN